METKSLNQILETSVSAGPALLTEMPPALNCNGKAKEWSAKWLKLQTRNHPKLLALEAAGWWFCKGYTNNPATGLLMVFYGNNGTGKTYTAKAIYRWACHIGRGLRTVPIPDDDGTGFKTPDALFAHWPTFLDELKGGAWDTVVDLERASMLILDDVGAAYDPSKVGLDKLCRILSKRERRWTLVTTNLSPDTWEDAFDRRAASRLFRNAEHVDLSDVPDFCAA